MIVEAKVTIRATRAAVWAAITDVERAASVCRGIERVAVSHRPARGLVGLRWQETRQFFGESATVEKWITDAAENESFTARSERDGFVFLTTMRVSASGATTVLTSRHEYRPQGLVARLKSLPMVLFRGVARKAILQDLRDIQAELERR